MSKAAVLKMASELVDENPSAAKLLLQLSKCESGSEIVSALDTFDVETADVSLSI
jgi:hypothetical protein